MSVRETVRGEHSSKELLEQHTLFAIRNLYMAPPVYVQDSPTVVGTHRLSIRSVKHSPM
jgi:hypothetical protein